VPVSAFVTHRLRSARGDSSKRSSSLVPTTSSVSRGTVSTGGDRHHIGLRRRGARSGRVRCPHARANRPTPTFGRFLGSDARRTPRWSAKFTVGGVPHRAAALHPTERPTWTGGFLSAYEIAPRRGLIPVKGTDKMASGRHTASLPTQHKIVSPQGFGIPQVSRPGRKRIWPSFSRRAQVRLASLRPSPHGDPSELRRRG
jgi:hypothetical protein